MRPAPLRTQTLRKVSNFKAVEQSKSSWEVMGKPGKAVTTQGAGKGGVSLVKEGGGNQGKDRHGRTTRLKTKSIPAALLAC